MFHRLQVAPFRSVINLLNISIQVSTFSLPNTRFFFVHSKTYTCHFCLNFSCPKCIIVIVYSFHASRKCSLLKLKPTQEYLSVFQISCVDQFIFANVFAKLNHSVILKENGKVLERFPELSMNFAY